MSEIPDLEKIASAYLRAHESTAALGTRFVSKTPTQDTGGTTSSWVRVTQLDARDNPATGLEHAISYLLQCDVYAGADGGPPEANRNARAIRHALKGMQDTVQDGVTITSVLFTGHLRRPDTEFKPARERVILTAQIVAHA